MTTPQNHEPCATPDFEFYYTANPADIEAFRPEGLRRIEIIRRKGMDTLLSAEELYDILLEPYGRILCLALKDGAPVGMCMLHEAHDLFQGTYNLHIEMAQADNLPGLIESMIEEWDRLAEHDGYDSVRFRFLRKGWLRKMKMYEGAGYKVTTYIGEKRYGRWG